MMNSSCLPLRKAWLLEKNLKNYSFAVKPCSHFEPGARAGLLGGYKLLGLLFDGKDTFLSGRGRVRLVFHYYHSQSSEAGSPRLVPSEFGTVLWLLFLLFFPQVKVEQQLGGGEDIEAREDKWLPMVSLRFWDSGQAGRQHPGVSCGQVMASTSLGRHSVSAVTTRQCLLWYPVVPWGKPWTLGRRSCCSWHSSTQALDLTFLSKFQIWYFFLN